MVPNFALSLSFEGITLLRRSGDVWARIDDVTFESEDLDAAMSALRDKALSLDPKGAEVALVIPNEQIRYMALPDLGGDEIAREVAIRAGLDGATPYEVKDLSFDYSLSQGEILVAAVAQETLDEAQSFAKSHGFVPISYVAKAPDGQFSGAVFFGKAKGWRRAAKRLPEAVQIVEADEAALTPVDALAPAPEPEVEVASTAEVIEPETAPAPVPPQMAMEFDTVASQAEDTTAADDADDALSDEDDASDDDADGDDARQRRRARRAERRARQKAEEEAAAAKSAAPSSEDETPSEPLPVAKPQPETAAPERAKVAASAEAADSDFAVEPAETAEDTVGDKPEPETDLPAATAIPPAPELPKAGKAPALAGANPAPEAAPVTFSTIRASRSDGGGVPPAPRALKLGEDGARVESRFHPVLGKAQAAAKASPDAAKPADAPKLDTTAPKADAAPKIEVPANAIESLKPEPAPLADKERKRGSALGFLSGKTGTLKRGSKKAKAEKPGKIEVKAPAAPQPPLTAKPDLPAAAMRAAGVTAAGAAAKAPSPLSRLAALRADAVPGPEAPKTPVATPDAKPAKVEPPKNSTLSRLSRARKAQETAAPVGGAAALNERDRMTVFGMRKEQKIGGKPRFLGLMLTAALLVFLAGVAAWAKVFLDDGLASLFGRSEPTAVASLPEPQTTTPDAAPAETTDIALPDTPDDEGAEDIELAALDNSEPEGTTDAPVSVPIQPQVLAPEEAAATYAATGIWQRAPGAPMTPPADGVEDVYVASIDPSVQQFDAVALPQASQIGREAALEDPGLPPPADMTFDFDARGLIRATPEGALSPEGLRIFTGRPPVVPPLRTALVAPAPNTATDAPDAPASTDPLSAFRPEARPDDIVEQRERATFSGISRDELAALRPTQRPKTIQEEAAEAAPEEPATAQAVSASLVPLARPRNMAAIVRRAEAQRPADAEPAPVQTAAAAATGRAVAPSGPTATTVARAATDQNAIDLGRINLIGVYGTPSNRRALVRLPGSGKYEKVKIGDRLDGGRVRSIDDDALVYVKNGRSITLKMPRG